MRGRTSEEGRVAEPDAPAAPAGRWLQLFDAFRHWNFWLFYVNSTSVAVAYTLRQTTLGWLIFQLTRSPVDLAILNAINQLPTFVFDFLAGVAADRWNRRFLMVFSVGSRGFLMLFLAWLIYVDFIPLWLIFVIVFVNGVFGAMNNPARQALLRELLPPQHFLNGVSWAQTSPHVARVIAPPVTGWALQFVGFVGTTVACSCSWFAAALSILLMEKIPEGGDRGRGPGARGSFFVNLLDGFRYVKSNALVFSVVIFQVLPSIIATGYAVFLPVFADEVLGMGALGLGLLGGASGVGALLGAVVVGALGDFRRKGLLMVGGLVISGLAICGFALSTSFALSLAMLVIAGASHAAFSAAATALVQLSTPQEFQGRVVSIQNFANMGLHPVGTLAMGVLAQFIGAPMAVALGSASHVVLALVLYAALPRVRAA